MIFDRLTFVGIRARQVPGGMLSHDEASDLVAGIRIDANTMQNVSDDHAFVAKTGVDDTTCLTHSTKHKLSDVIDSKVNSARNAMRGLNTGPIARIKFRSHEIYQSEHCWTVYADTSTSNDVKLRTLHDQSNVAAGHVTAASG